MTDLPDAAAFDAFAARHNAKVDPVVSLDHPTYRAQIAAEDRLSAVLAAARTIASLAVDIPGHGMCILPAHVEALRDALSAADGAR